MELASPKPANEAIAIVAIKGARKKNTTTDAIDREQISQCMTSTPDPATTPRQSLVRSKGD
jgi:hypothetical protein